MGPQQYLLSIQTSIPNLLLQMTKEVNGLVKKSKPKATKWANELSDDDKGSIRGTMNEILRISLKLNDDMTDYEVQYKRLSKSVENDLESIVQKLTGKGREPQANSPTANVQSPFFQSPVSDRSDQSSGQLSYTPPFTPDSRGRSDPSSSLPPTPQSPTLNSSMLSNFKEITKAKIDEFDQNMTDALTQISRSSGMQSKRQLTGLINLVEKYIFRRFYVDDSNGSLKYILEAARLELQDREREPGFTEAIKFLRESEKQLFEATSAYEAANMSSFGAGKYSSQAKHYLSQDYYTFVDTMPKKRFL